MDGQGPEHSSGRLERFLRHSGEPFEVDLGQPVKRQILHNNLQVIVPSFAANYFHALRRQMRRLYRKPLVTFNSKKLLRLRRATSALPEFEVKRFLTCVPEASPRELVAPDRIRRVLVCSGQVFYDLEEARKAKGVNDVAIVRVEQLAPFPYEHLRVILKDYRQAEFCWVQEEHKNYGAWDHVNFRIEQLLAHLRKAGNLTNPKELAYVGRKVSASPSTGLKKVHDQELKEFIDRAFE
jgi:2-oxoglutarate dehydrogenase E1 component